MENKRTLGVRIAGGLLRLQGSLPLSWHYRLAGLLAWLVEKLFHYRNSVVLVNLSRCFPEKTYEEIVDVKHRFYRHFARTVAEMVWFGACRGKKGRERLRRSHIVEIGNVAELNRVIGENGRVVILQSHTGNWELMGGIAQYAYSEPARLSPDTFAVTYMALHSKFWDQVMAENRSAPVCDLGFEGYVETSSVLRFVLARKDRDYAYVFNTDQYPYIGNGARTQVEFMGQETVTMTGAAALACKLDMAVFYLRFECREEGGYRMSFVPMEVHAGGKDPAAIMQQYYHLLEEDLRKQPWNYLWTHKRWKKV